jgi:hypothetical protein
MALKNAADARMKIRNIIRPSHSSLSRRFIQERVYRHQWIVNSPYSGGC